MLFNSISFCFFFPTVVAGFFLLPQKYGWLWLLLASCYFYMAFVPIYILILGGTIVVDYFAGRLIGGAKTKAKRKLWLTLSLVANVGVLCVFKYWAFICQNVDWLARLFGSGASLPALHIILPIGLSFHTFQAMSYTIEVYRGHQEPERHFGIYALYVMFFPQLVAGPIERPQNLLAQFHARHHFEYERVVSGLQLMALGMFKKVVLADRLSLAGDKVWAHPEAYHGVEILSAIVMFSFQIYLDFSAYSEIAIGAARVLGFDLMRNFDFPYFASSLGDFWRRWHISLSTWFRDYLYFPLGGNRHHGARNIAIVFLLSGLWHGASWTFVIWGAIHGGFRLLERWLTPAVPAEVSQTKSRVELLARGLLTFSVVATAWIFFRASTLHDAITMLRNITHGPGNIRPFLTSLLLVGAFVCFEIVDRRQGLFERLRRWPSLPRHAAYAGLIYATVFLSVPTNVQFIYFQF